ncbi:MAG: FtsQ-type POTRA domain-containing protein [Anaerolineaceae bacterium]|nr:FtsQ-type POTRA domain-containing protein [Anaerolineaceae bacterium]
MSLRSRDRRRTGRTPAVLRSVPAAKSDGQETIQHGARTSSAANWRIVSFLIVVLLSAVLFVFFWADVFYIHSISVGGLHYTTKEEVFALTGIANMHVFWVDPVEVRQAILRSPTVADAQVIVGWPPNMVQIVVEEREPAFVWEQAGVATWIDLQGRVMRQREDRPDLVRVVAENSIEGPIGPNTQLEDSIVSGTLQLHALFPDLPFLRYDPIKGLGFQDIRGWQAWFGVGTDMPEKISIYNGIINNLLSRGIQPGEVNVVNPDAPYYSAAWGR